MSAPALTREGTETKERILDAAERLFAARGFAATSLRAITGAAGVNVAAVHYHFGSRETLLRAVLHRRIDPVNDARLGRLDQLEAADGAPSVEVLLDALLAPAFDQIARDPAAQQMPGLLFSAPPEHGGELVSELFGQLARRFAAALGRALPELSQAEAHERLGFVVGVMVHELAGHDPLHEGGDRPRGTPEIRERMIRFLAAGLRAPAARGGNS